MPFRLDPPGARACVIGHPVAHSRSPMVHNFWLDQLGRPERYGRADVAPADFAAFVDAMPGLGLLGGNVTIPHKEAAAMACAVLTPRARALGAANTLWFEDGRLHGDNTDVEGFLANLDAGAPGWDAAHAALVIGAGGAARAIVHGLVERGVKYILIANRTRRRAEELAAHCGGRAVDWADLPEAIGKAELLVNTTSLGMAGQPPLDLPLAGLRREAVVTDAVYVPLETPLLAAARRQGLRTVGGLGMLLHQAAPAFARWFGTRPAVTERLYALVEADIAAR